MSEDLISALMVVVAATMMGAILFFAIGGFFRYGGSREYRDETWYPPPKHPPPGDYGTFCVRNPEVISGVTVALNNPYNTAIGHNALMAVKKPTYTGLEMG